MSSRVERGTMPPPAPPSRRRIRFAIGQVVGIALLSVLPILAVFDRFGTRQTLLTASSDDVSLAIEYSPRARYGLPTQVRIEARALRGADAGPVMVRVAAGFIDRFAQISLSPAPTKVDPSHYTFVLPASDAVGVILLEFEPEHYGRAHGRVVASLLDGKDGANVDLSAFVFP